MLGHPNAHPDPRFSYPADQSSAIAVDHAITQLITEPDVQNITATQYTVAYQLPSTVDSSSSLKPLPIPRQLTDPNIIPVPRHDLDKDHQEAMKRLKSLQESAHDKLVQHDTHIQHVLDKKRELVSKQIQCFEQHHREATQRHQTILDSKVAKLHSHNMTVEQHCQYAHSHPLSQHLQHQAGVQYMDYVRSLSMNQDHHHQQMKEYRNRRKLSSPEQLPIYPMHITSSIPQSISIPEPYDSLHFYGRMPFGSGDQSMASFNQQHWLHHDQSHSPVSLPVHEDRSSSTESIPGCAPFEFCQEE